MSVFTESVVERAALAWFETLGYAIAGGPSIAPGEPGEERQTYANVVLNKVHEEPDPGESAFPQDTKQHFRESVKASFAEAQDIIIENSHQLPGDGVLDGVRLELFTGNDQGRRGFIPQAGNAT